MCFDFLYNVCLKYLSFQEELRRYDKKSSCKELLIHVLFYRNLNFLDSFEKNSNVKFHENPPSGSRVFYADKRTDRQAWQTFRNFSKASNNGIFCDVVQSS